ncbi:MAG: dihydroorotate dehydrogenase electron transfer subunit [Thermodesulfovibrionales bacterium]|nr:dihydroorotate dehydrogenase electron transfer subunit [Thermodesulfovibrionales bacterium]
MNKFFPAKAIESVCIGKNFHFLRLTPLEEIILPIYGQFYMLQCGETYDPLLKRPFSIFDYDATYLEFLFRVKGKGTSLLSQTKKGQLVYLLGPLGNGYPQPPGDFIVVAGGIGIASLMPLLKFHQKRAILFYGARNSDELVMRDRVSEMAKHYYFSTDDGSIGQQGLITDLFFNFLDSNGNLTNLPVYACGSTPMLKTLREITEKYHIICYASVEEYMACGIGACLGCVIKIKNYDDISGFQYSRVCKEGPVFALKDIFW